MPFDGVCIRAITNELNSDLFNARIDKIYQPEKDELMFSIRQPGIGPAKILISANARWARMHINTSKKENPSTPPAFCMLLRKHLEGGKIKEIKQVDFERIVHIRIEALNEFKDWAEKLIICEFMGKHSNIILINPENNLIIDAIKKYGHDLSSYREVLPGKEYKNPPDQAKLNPLNTDLDTFAQAMWNTVKATTLAGSLFNVFSGISPFTAREICLNTGLDPDMPVEQSGEFELSKLYTHLKQILEDINKGENHPGVLYEKNIAVDFAPYTLSKTSSQRFIETASINTACDRYYKNKLDIIRLESMKTNLMRNVKVFLDKANKRKFLQEGDLAQAKENKKYKIWGELITAYYYQLKKGDLEATLTDFYSDKKVNIKLDPRYTPIQNAQRYFKKYNKSTKAIKHLQIRMLKNQQEIDYLESVVIAINQAEHSDELNEIIKELEKEGYLKKRHRHTKIKAQKSKPRKFLSSNGLEILVGRNNTQNDFLTLKLASRHDLWLHTKEIPGTHVIVKLPKTISSIDDIPDSTLEEAAAFAAYYSKASQADKVPVDYTFTANVYKPKGAKPGMVIYDNYWTIIANPTPERIKQLFEKEEHSE